MKKKICFVIILFVFIVVYASDTFVVKDKINLNMEDDILSSFPNEYKLSYEIKYDDVGNEIIDLSKKTTYLLLGTKNFKEEKTEDFYRRHNEYLKLRYNPVVPKDPNSVTGLDENSQEYKDDIISGFSVPGMFNQINELDIKYSSFGDIRVFKSNDVIISAVLLPNITMKQEDPDNPLEYMDVRTNLILYYYYKPLNGVYKLYYLVGETKDSIEEYLDSVKNNGKSNQVNIAPQYDSSINNIYNTNKLKNITNEDLNKIYENNRKNLATIISYYNNNYEGGSSFIGNGFFINKGLIVTTWDFLLRTLQNGQSLTVLSNNKSYEVDGIVTVNKKANIALLKLVEETDSYVKLSKDIKIGDPVISISNNVVSYSAIKGLLVSNDDYYQSTIPLSLQDEGSPIFNIDGYVIGMSTSMLINSPTSLGVPYEALIEVQEKFNNIDFNSIKVIPFSELKDHYYVNYGVERENINISDSKWKEINDITKIEENIHMRLIKANYNNGVVSLRYQNNMANYVNTIQMSLSFRNNLVKNGFKEVLASNKKYIYEKDNYQITIMEELDYLVVVIVT